MSRETLQWLNTMTLIGFTDKRGRAWHDSANARGDAPDNHYSGAVPFHKVEELIGSWTALSAKVQATIPADIDTMTGLNDQGMPVRLVTDETRQAIVHSVTGRILGVHSSTYEIHQYRMWLLNQVSTLLGDSLAVGSAGLLRQCAQAWVQIESPDTVQTSEGFDFRPHLLASTSHDGSIPTTFRRCVTAVVCDNTMSAALREGGSVFRVKHTRNSALKLKDARQALQIIDETADSFAAQVTELANATVTDLQWFKFLDAYVPIDSTMKGRGLTIAQNKRESLSAMYRNDNRVSPWAGTALGVVQAVNTWTHHSMTVRGSDRGTRNQERAVLGKVDELDRSTLETLTRILQPA